MNQNTGLKRNTLDKYYTNKKVAIRCIKNFLKYNTNLKVNSVIVEPSAGSGVFIKPFEGTKFNIKPFDIKPEYKNIVEQDFLELILTDEDIHYLGNPPFGRQSSLAKKFIKKCCKDGKSISFILPKSFKKESMKKCFDNYFHLVYQEDLEDNSFVINGNKEVDVPCVFQIWIKKDTKRAKTKIYKPNKFKWVKKEENPDFSLRRVGVYAGKISVDIDNKSKQSHNFIVLNEEIDKEQFSLSYENIKYEENNVVGPKSICKNEFTKEINKIINELS